MSAFEGFLEDVQLSQGCLVVRFVAPGFDPETEGSPIMYLELREPIDIAGTHAELLQVRERDPDCYVSVVSQHQATVTTDHGNEVTLSAKAITARYSCYEAKDG